MPKGCVAKIRDQLPVLNRLTDIFAVGKFDYGVMVRYQNLTRKPELFRAPLGQGPGTMYPLNPPLAGPVPHYAPAQSHQCKTNKSFVRPGRYNG